MADLALTVTHFGINDTVTIIGGWVYVSVCLYVCVCAYVCLCVCVHVCLCAQYVNVCLKVYACHSGFVAHHFIIPPWLQCRDTLFKDDFSLEDIWGEFFTIDQSLPTGLIVCAPCTDEGWCWVVRALLLVTECV